MVGSRAGRPVMHGSAQSASSPPSPSPCSLKWLARRGLFREADASNEAPSYSEGEAMTLAGMQRGTLETAKDTGERAEHELAEPPPRITDAAVNERFNLHASVHVPAHDDRALREGPRVRAVWDLIRERYADRASASR